MIKRVGKILTVLALTALTHLAAAQGGVSVLSLPLQTGVAAVFGLVLSAAVYPVIHARRLETVEVLRSS